MKAFVVLLAIAAALQLTLAQEEAVDTVNFDDEFTERIIGGHNTTFSRHTVRLLRNGRFIGTGALISRQHVLTSASNIINPRDNIEFDPKELTLVVGQQTVNPANRGSRAVKASDVQAHFNYLGRSNGHANNLAVITLQNPVRLNNAIAPISINAQRAPASGQSWVVGFGNTARWGRPANALQLAQLANVNSRVFARANPRVTINSNTFFLQTLRGASLTNSDSGAITLAYGRGTWQLAGIVSYSPSVNHTVVTHVHPYTSWINGVTSN